MNGLDDDDMAREVEQAAKAYALWQIQTKVALNDLREHLVAVATARLSGVRDDKACEALDAHVAKYGPDDVYLLVDMLTAVLWDGVRSVDREARTRLMGLNKANTVEELQATLMRRP